jgi:hypothetical protein
MKNRVFIVVFSAILLVCAGMVMVGCPSDVDPPVTISDYDLILYGGKYQFKFETPLIEQGKEYEVIFTINNCDEDFNGSRMGGKICYKTDINDDSEGAEKVLSGWDYCVPAIVNVIDGIRRYKWTFKAGEKNQDGVTIENPATTPEGAVQYFSLTAQDGAWHNYDSDFNFKIKGGFEVISRETITNWVSEGVVTLGNEEGIAGKGALTEADMAKIRALPPRSEIRITVNVEVNSTNQPGYGVCSVGGWDDNNSLSIQIPKTINGQPPPNGPLTFTINIEIADLLGLQPEGWAIAINPYNGATVTKAELFRPGP